MLQYKSIFGKENYSKGSQSAEMWLATIITTFVLLCRGVGARAIWLQISPFSEEGLSPLRWLPRRKTCSASRTNSNSHLSGGRKSLHFSVLSPFISLYKAGLTHSHCVLLLLKQRIMYWIGNYRFCLAFHEWLEHKNNLQTQVGTYWYLMPAPNPVTFFLS